MVSPGCAHCYAETMSNRLRGMAIADEIDGKNPGRKAHYLKVINEDGKWTGRVELVPEALTDPLGWKKPRRVFVNSMSDLFHEDVPFDYIDKVFAVMALCPQHTFQVLTKRPARMSDYFAGRDDGASRWACVAAAVEKLTTTLDGRNPSGKYLRESDWPLSNALIGFSAEDQERFDDRYAFVASLGLKGWKTFCSAEPLLGPLELMTWFLTTRRPDGKPPLDWLIVGGESGRGARVCYTNWIDSIVQQCRAAGVAVFVKQLGANHRCITDQEGDCEIPLKDSKGGDIAEFPEDLRVREFPEPAAANA